VNCGPPSLNAFFLTGNFGRAVYSFFPFLADRFFGGGAGQFGEVYLKIEPMARGAGFGFVGIDPGNTAFTPLN